MLYTCRPHYFHRLRYEVIPEVYSLSPCMYSHLLPIPYVPRPRESILKDTVSITISSAYRLCVRLLKEAHIILDFVEPPSGIRDAMITSWDE